VPFSYIKGKYLVVEEKIDGANSAISFSENGELLLQSRGQYLTGGWFGESKSSCSPSITHPPGSSIWKRIGMNSCGATPAVRMRFPNRQSAT